MDTAYNRRIASANDAIMERYARHAPTNFVGRGYGSDSGIDTQYNDVMRGAANHPRALSRAEKEYRMEGDMASFGGSFLDDLGEAFRYTPGLFEGLGRGRDTVLSGRGKLTITHGGADGVGGAMCGGKSYANVGVTMPFREVPYAGVMDFANPLSSGSGKPKFPLETKVQVGNSDGSGRPLDKPPQVEAAWYESMDDFVGGRNRMRDSKKVGRMTKDPELVACGGRDFTAEEMKFVEDLLMKGGAGFYGGAWYNDWGDFTSAVSDAYDTVKGVYEDYIKPVMDVVGTPLKDALLSSGNPYGEAGAGFLELLGYGQNGMSDAVKEGAFRQGMYGAPSGMSGGMDMMEILEKNGPPVGGMYGVSSGRSGGRMMKGSPEMKAHMAKLRAMKGKGIGGMKGCGEGVFADAKPIRANSLGFSPQLEVEQLNAATGSTSYGTMPSSNPVGSGMGCGIGGRKRKIVPKNVRGVSSAPTKMGEGKLTGGALQDIMAAIVNGLIAGISGVPSAVSSAAKRLKKTYNREDVQVILAYLRDHPDVLIPFLPVGMAAGAVLGRLLQTYLNMPTRAEEWEMVDEALDAPPVVDMDGAGKKKIPKGFHRMPSGQLMKNTPDCPHSKGGSKLEREGLAITGDNSMGAVVAERGFSNKAQQDAGAVELVAKDNLYDGEKFETSRGRSGKKINNLILNGITKGVSQGGAMSGGRQLVPKGQLQGVVGGGFFSDMGSSLLGTFNDFVKSEEKSSLYDPPQAIKDSERAAAAARRGEGRLEGVVGGVMSKMKSEYSGKGAHGGKSAYNALVSETMKATGMKLAEAVKHIKEKGLYTKK